MAVGFTIRSNGSWLERDGWGSQKEHGVDYSNCCYSGGPVVRPIKAIRRGVGATNVLRVRIADYHFEYFINGTKVFSKEQTDMANREVAIVGALRLSADDFDEVLFRHVI